MTNTQTEQMTNSTLKPGFIITMIKARNYKALLTPKTYISEQVILFCGLAAVLSFFLASLYYSVSGDWISALSLNSSFFILLLVLLRMVNNHFYRTNRELAAELKADRELKEDKLISAFHQDYVRLMALPDPARTKAITENFQIIFGKDNEKAISLSNTYPNTLDFVNQLDAQLLERLYNYYLVKIVNGK